MRMFLILYYCYVWLGSLRCKDIKANSLFGILGAVLLYTINLWHAKEKSVTNYSTSRYYISEILPLPGNSWVKGLQKALCHQQPFGTICIPVRRWSQWAGIAGTVTTTNKTHYGLCPVHSAEGWNQWIAGYVGGGSYRRLELLLMNTCALLVLCSFEQTKHTYTHCVPTPILCSVGIVKQHALEALLRYGEALGSLCHLKQKIIHKVIIKQVPGEHFPIVGVGGGGTKTLWEDPCLLA